MHIYCSIVGEWNWGSDEHGYVVRANNGPTPKTSDVIIVVIIISIRLIVREWWIYARRPCFVCLNDLLSGKTLFWFKTVHETMVRVWWLSVMKFRQ